MAIRRPGAAASTDAPATIKERDIVSAAHYSDADNTTRLLNDLEGDHFVTKAWYGQLLVTGTEPRSLDTTIDATLQQYEKVMELRLVIQDAVSFSSDLQTGSYETTGEAYIFPGTVTPIVGDMFVASLSPAQEAVFTVTSVNSLSVYKRPAYQIEYKVWGVNDDIATANLETKSVAHYYFSKERFVRGDSPIVTYTEANRAVNYTATIERLVRDMYDRFYDHENRVFVYTQDDLSIYDPTACEFFNAIVPKALRAGRPRVVSYADGSHPAYIKRPSLWRALIQRSSYNMHRFPRAYLPVRTGELAKAEIWYSISMTQLDYIMLPDTTTLDGATADKPYVVSNECYEGTGVTDKFEDAILSMISNQPIDAQVILDAINALDVTDAELPEHRRFYKTILLLCMLVFNLHEIQ